MYIFSSKERHRISPRYIDRSQNMAAGQLEPWCDLQNKVVLVTGASSGIGREFCLDLARAGCRIVAAARRSDRLKSLCDEINQQAAADPSAGQPRAVAVQLDLTADSTAIAKCIQSAWDAFGTIDALINNAGFRGNVNNPLELSEEEWNQVMRTNLRGSWLVAKHVCMHMRDAKRGGSVINISSVDGLNRGHLPGAIAYAASKSAVNTMTKVMAMELGVHNIRVNSIAPGLFKSEITQGLWDKDWFRKVEANLPLGSFGAIDPGLTFLVRYLIHDSSQYVSGNIFLAEAGITLQGVPLPLHSNL
ncbi:hypothetical protein Tsubulata_046458 [Turnera subulata]|uniref:Ketoreductase domain-containing protein n=1 Tax=Turnera subulata TaxID=218843 RepID=A0A9Q0J0H7_9ROSI|nr:hypothetical protein Tsubulata_046458 [Turnera subulata]